MFKVLFSCALLFVFHAAMYAPAQDKSDAIDAMFRPLVSSDSPGFAVEVIRDGHVLVSRGYGTADLRTRAPISAATNFRLASVSKQFTAMAIMLLVHDGKLHYDDRLTSIFPNFPAYGSNITVRNLLNHTSGLKHYEDVYERQTAGKRAEQIPQLHDADVLAIEEQQQSGAFPPGSRWEYSNSGYAVLAQIVERISGTRYETFLHDRIFAPLAMNHTLAYVKGENQVPNRAFGYRQGKGADWEFSDQSPTSAVLGDGGIYSSLEDLAKWDRALLRNTLLSESEMKPAYTPVQAPDVKLPDGSTSQYGFGWFLGPYKGHRRMSHYGETCGFRSAIQRFPDDRLTVVVLSNRIDADPQALATRVVDLYLQ